MREVLGTHDRRVLGTGSTPRTKGSGWARLPLAGLLATVLLPSAAAAQLFPNLPFDHKQFTLEMVGADHLRLTGEVLIEGEGYDLYADQVDIYLETSAEAGGDPPGTDLPDGPETAADTGPAGDDAAGEETGIPSARLVASGDVVFSAPEVRLSADRVEYWTGDQRAVLPRSLRLDRPGR